MVIYIPHCSLKNRNVNLALQRIRYPDNASTSKKHTSSRQSELVSMFRKSAHFLFNANHGWPVTIVPHLLLRKY